MKAMKVTIRHTERKRVSSKRERAAACERSYRRYTLGLPSRAEQQLDPDLRRAASIEAADEAEASYRLAVASFSLVLSFYAGGPT